MKCRHCGTEIVRIGTTGGPVVCDAALVTYWRRRGKSRDIELITPNGISFYGSVDYEDLKSAIGVAYVPHTCHQLTLVLLGRDSHDRPVYRGLTDGKLYVDTEPRKGWEPRICTKYQDKFDGEPCDPVEADFRFVPKRDTW